MDKSSIAAVSLTTQRSTVINVDQQGKPLRPAIVWLDQRRTEGLKPVGGLWGAAFAVAGASETVAYLQAEAEANWIRTNQPQVWNETYKYLFLSGYLTFRLVGQFVDSVSSQVGYVPFDYKSQTWAKSWDWKWQAVPMDKRILPDLVPAASQLGLISSEGASATGIPQGLPLIAAAADKAKATCKGLEQVAYTGYGVTLMDIGIFDQVEAPWFELAWLGDGNYATTDAYLAEKVRKAGIPIDCDHDLSNEIGHVGHHVFTLGETEAWNEWRKQNGE